MIQSSIPTPVTSQGSLKRLASHAVSPAVVDFWVQKLMPTWSWDRCLARIVARRVEARGVVTLVLQPNRNWRGLGGFKPGQHMNVSAEVNGVRVTRSYSLSDVPRTDGCLSITIKHVEGGRLSEYLCRDARVGDVLELGQAFGQMSWAEPPRGQWLLLAAGSGITPLMSLIRSVLGGSKRGSPRGMPEGLQGLTLVYWARTRAELCFAAELQEMARREPRLTVHTVLTREPGAALTPTERVGRLSAEALQGLGLSDLSQQQVLACGPGGFVNRARTLAAGQALSFQAEAFTLLEAAPLESGSVQVHLQATGRTLELPVGQTLLTALEAQGVFPPSGCRMGICRTCVCPKLEGSTQDLITGELSHEADSALRLCVSTARTPITLNL